MVSKTHGLNVLCFPFYGNIVDSRPSQHTKLAVCKCFCSYTYQEYEMQKGGTFSVVRRGIIIQEDSSLGLSLILGSSESPVTPAQGL